MKRLAAILLTVSICLLPVVSYADSKQIVRPTVDTTKVLDTISTLKTKNKNLYGEKIACMGDSITLGAGGTQVDVCAYIGYPNYLAVKSGADVVNLGVGGSTVGDYNDNLPMVLRMETIPADTTKVIFWGGLNDFLHGPEYMEKYKEDIRIAFAYLYNRFDSKDVFIVTTYKNKGELWGQNVGYSLSEYMDYQVELAEEYGFNVIDLYNNDILSQENPENEKYFADDLHPSDEGYQYLGKYLFYKILESEKDE